MEDINNITKFAKKIRKNILDMSLSAGSASAHFGGAMSSVEIVSSLYCSIMNYNKDNYKLPERDRFILSKGHACLVLYSALAEKAVLPCCTAVFALRFSPATNLLNPVVPDPLMYTPYNVAGSVVVAAVAWLTANWTPFVAPVNITGLNLDQAPQHTN